MNTFVANGIFSVRSRFASETRCLLCGAQSSLMLRTDTIAKLGCIATEPAKSHCRCLSTVNKSCCRYEHTGGRFDSPSFDLYLWQHCISKPGPIIRTRPITNTAFSWFQAKAVPRDSTWRFKKGKSPHMPCSRCCGMLELRLWYEFPSIGCQVLAVKEPICCHSIWRGNIKCPAVYRFYSVMHAINDLISSRTSMPWVPLSKAMNLSTCLASSTSCLGCLTKTGYLSLLSLCYDLGMSGS